MTNEQRDVVYEDISEAFRASTKTWIEALEKQGHAKSELLILVGTALIDIGIFRLGQGMDLPLEECAIIYGNLIKELLGDRDESR